MAENGQMKDLLNQITDGVKAVYNSKAYKIYLSTMAKFHQYSYGNVMLIMAQCPNATHIAGYQKWKKDFGRQVQTGEKGIRIIAYNPRRIKTEEKQIENEKAITAKVDKIVPGFSTAYVFDISQTEGRPLPKLMKELNGTVESYHTLVKVISAVSPYPVSFETIMDNAKGYCDFGAEKIVIRNDMSESQTIKTLVHELAHATIHVPNSFTSDYATNEMEAESTAFVVCNHYGIDTSDYSFSYIAFWGRNKEVQVLRDSLNRIQKHASQMIDNIDGQLAMSKEQSVQKQEKGYDGFDFLKNLAQIGGQLETVSMPSTVENNIATIMVTNTENIVEASLSAMNEQNGVSIVPENMHVDSFDTKLIAAYEKATGVPPSDIITRWFGDFDLNEIKYGIPDEVVNRRISDALAAIRMNYQEYHDSDLRFGSSSQLESTMKEYSQLSLQTQQPGFESWSEPAAIANAPESLGIPSDNIDTYLPPQRLFVDMDGTLAVFSPVDTLETLYRPGYFANLQPIDNVVQAVKTIIKDYPEIEVNILSSYLSDSPFALEEKNAWLDRYLPEVDKAHRIFSPCGKSKTDYVPEGLREDDHLLDDYTQNLNDWEPPAKGIKLLNGINHTRGTWQGDRIRSDRAPLELAVGIVGAMKEQAKIQDEKKPVMVDATKLSADAQAVPSITSISTYVREILLEEDPTGTQRYFGYCNGVQETDGYEALDDLIIQNEGFSPLDFVEGGKPSPRNRCTISYSDGRVERINGDEVNADFSKMTAPELKHFVDRHTDVAQPAAHQQYTVPATSKPRYTQEQYEAANNFDLYGYLQANGYDLTTAGPWHRWKEHNSFAVHDDGRWHWHSQNIGGGPIQYFVKVENMSVVDAVLKLSGERGFIVPGLQKQRAESKSEEKPPLELPAAAKECRHVMAYLIKTRGIDPQIVKELIKDGLIYESEAHHNAVFVGYGQDGIPKYAAQRGTGTEDFKRDVLNTDKSYGFTIRGTSETRVAVFEAPIDAISHKCIEKMCGADYSAITRIALGGVSDLALERYVKEHPLVTDIVVGTDNDKAGDAAAERFKKKYENMGYKVTRISPRGKDFNEDIQNIRAEELAVNRVKAQETAAEAEASEIG